MMQTGYFLIADITGYTKFLTESEFEHAQDIIKNLLDVVLEHIKPPFIVSNFQGDAILSYCPDSIPLKHQTLIEYVDELYFAFMWARSQQAHHTTCQCEACRNIPNLNLKLFLHRGEFMFHELGERVEIAGPDVITVHRMMKNSVRETTGIDAYALMTARVLSHITSSEFVHDMIPHQETYEHIGDVDMLVYNLKPMWTRRLEQRRVKLEADDAHTLVYETILPVPPSIVWGYVLDAKYRQLWMFPNEKRVDSKSNGRIDVGTRFHCLHGKHEIPFVIQDWRPFEYLTTDNQAPSFLPYETVRRTFRFEPYGTGTKFTYLMGPKTTPLKRWQNFIMTIMPDALGMKILKDAAQVLSKLIDADIRSGKIDSVR